MYEATEADIEKAYEILVPESRGREADNPELLARYLLDPDYERHSNPTIALAEFKDDRTLTWHVVCDRYMPRNLVDQVTNRLRAEAVSSRERGDKVLRFIELYSWSDKKYHILDDITTHNPMISTEDNWD